MNTVDSIARPYWLHALTPMHIGSGQGTGYIDLPVVREAVTNWPYAPGSAVKGVVADHFGATDQERGRNPLLAAAFGRAGDASANAGALAFTDARLVCLPVRSYFGTFAWCTSSTALSRLRRDLTLSGSDCPPSLGAQPGQVIVSADDGGRVASALGREHAYLEDLDFRIVADPAAGRWATYVAERAMPEPEWRRLFVERFAIVPDDVFDFFSDTSLQVDARVRIHHAMKSVDRGALWYEESLPAETVLSGIAWCGRVFGQSEPHPSQSDILTQFCRQDKDLLLQIGGKFTTGRGHVRLRFESARG